jgi:hypothetical protein
LTGYISEGIALCGKGQIKDAMEAFDLAGMFTDGQSKPILLLIKAGQSFPLYSLVHHVLRPSHCSTQSSILGQPHMFTSHPMLLLMVILLLAVTWK